MKKTITWTFVVLTGIILLYLWVGFFLPNPAMESWDTWYKYRIVLWLPRIIIPLLYCIILLMVFTKDRKLSQNIATLFGTFLILFLIAASLIYVNKSKTRSGYIKDQYHPYLQILPPSTADLNKASGKKAIRIFCLGGSTTAWKNSKNVGWPESLEKELRQFYHSDSIFVFNFGIPWYTTLHTLINFETNLRQHKPDVIIVMHNINDFLQNADFSYLSNGSFRQDYGHFLGPLVDLIKPNFAGLSSFQLARFRNLWYYDFPKKTVFEQDSFPGLDSYSRNINTLIDLASLDSTKIILLTQPYLFTENMDEKTKKVCYLINYEAVGKTKKWGFHTALTGMNQYNRRVKEIAENRNVNLIDLEASIPKSLLYFKDEVHYNDTSFVVIFKTLSQEIISRGILSNLKLKSINSNNQSLTEIHLK